MTQPTDWQPELFREFEPPAKPPWWAKYWRPPQRFVVLRLAHEDLILGVIGALMVVIVGFCLGVERGKQLVVARADSSPAAVPAIASPAPLLAAPTVPVTPVIPAPRLIPPSASQAPTRTRVADASEDRYVVQVASFADRAEAEASRARLAKQGVGASVAAKGRYYVLFAGGFSTYAQATEAAGHLRDSYRDCFIRKLTSDQRG